MQNAQVLHTISIIHQIIQFNINSTLKHKIQNQQNTFPYEFKGEWLASLTFAIITSKNSFNKGAPQFHNLRYWITDVKSKNRP